MILRRARPLLVLLVILVLTGCRTADVPPMPATVDTVVLQSPLTPTDLYAKTLAAFLRVGWDTLTPTSDEEGLATTVVSDGEYQLPVAVRITPSGEREALLTATVDTTATGSRDVLERTARVLTFFRGELSYR